MSALALSKLRLEPDGMKISSSSTDSGESEDTIETPYNFSPLVVGFNSSYLIDFLKAIGNSGEVRLEFKDAQSAGQVRPEDADEESEYRFIIMPMRPVDCPPRQCMLGLSHRSKLCLIQRGC